MGPADPALRVPGEIRYTYGSMEDPALNAIHGSDSDFSAYRETGLFLKIVTAVLLGPKA